MKLKDVKLLREDGEAFHLQHGNDKAFRVAKKGLSATLHGRIAQHFAEGGEVFAPAPDAQQTLADSVMSQPTGVEAQQAALANYVGMPPPNMSLGGKPREAPAAYVPSDAVWQAIAESPAVQTAVAGRAGEAPEKAAPADEVVSAPAPSAPAAPASSAPAPAPKADNPMAGLPGGTAPGLQRGLDAATKAQQEAIGAQAKLVADAAAQQADIQTKAMAERAALQKEWEAKLTANQGRADKVAADISSTKINPDAFWQSRDTGQRVSAVLAMALGGFYAGYTGRDNPVEKALNTAIERDIEAQKANLAKKQTELGYYMQQGHTLREAAQLATADSFQRTAAQAQLVATKLGGAMAGPQAAEASAKLLEKAQLLRQQVYVQGFEVREKALAMKLHMETLKANAEAKAGQAALAEAARTGRLPPQLEAQAPEALAKRLVHVAEERPVTRNGQPVLDASGKPQVVRTAVGRLALDEDAAKKARELVRDYSDANRVLSKLIALREKFGAKEKLTPDAFNGAVSEARSNAKQYVTLYNKSNHLGALDNGTLELAKDIMGGDPAGIGPVLDTLKGLKRNQDASYNTALKAYLVSND
jgi:hypothetical protein